MAADSADGTIEEAHGEMESVTLQGIVAAVTPVGTGIRIDFPAVAVSKENGVGGLLGSGDDGKGLQAVIVAAPGPEVDAVGTPVVFAVITSFKVTVIAVHDCGGADVDVEFLSLGSCFTSGDVADDALGPVHPGNMIIVVVGIHESTQRNLLHVADAADLACLRTGLAQSRKKHGSQNGDNSDDHQQFNEGKDLCFIFTSP